ncbi:MAG: FtsQ-type POTRA domain-containing protein [Pseudomonadota bacterium]
MKSLLRTSEMLGLVCVLLVSLLAALGALGARSMLASQHLPIRWVEASGPFERVPAEQIRATAASLVDGGFFAVDLDQVRTSIEALPWIRSAGVRKRWPDTISIRVLEHEPLAHWGERQLVSLAGEVFSVDGASQIGGMVRLTGPDGTAPQVVRFLSVLQENLSATGQDVMSLALSDRGAWTATLTSGLDIQFGSSDIEARLNRLVIALRRLPEADRRQLLSLDLRYPNGLAARWAQDSSLTQIGESSVSPAGNN